MTVSRAAVALALATLLSSSIACGKKGDPLAPLRLVPAAVSELAARRSAAEVELQFTLPKANANGPGPIDLDRIEVYAVTVGTGFVAPANRDLLTKARVVGTIPVKPPPVEDGPPADPADKRPAVGDRVTFVEELTPEKIEPTPGLATAPAAAPATPAATKEAAAAAAKDPAAAATNEAAPATPGQLPGTPQGTPPTAPPTAPPAAAAPAPPAVATQPARIYVVRGIARSGRPGPPSARVTIPLVSPVAPPTAVVATMPTEKGVVVDWTPPLAEPGGSPLAFNVYRRETPTVPLNQKPLAEIKFETGAFEYGKEQCFVVRAIQVLQNVTIESDPSAPGCLTPLDKFPPAAPRNLRTLAEEGAVNLVWEQNTEADLAGYLVLRDDGAGGTLQPITANPVRDASYRDTTATPGLRYTYAVVAVDSTTPGNQSAPSTPESVTAR